MSELFKQVIEQAFVSGRFQPLQAQRTFDVLNPATEEVLGAVADVAEAAVAEVVREANAAQKGWCALSASERAQALHGVAQRLRDMQKLLAEAMTREMGKPFKESSDEISWAASAFDFYAEAARLDAGRVLGATVPGQMQFVLKEPYGVAVCIMPFNYPMCLFAWQAAAALAAGNAVIVKPAEQTSLTTLLAMKAFNRLPAGVMQCVTGGPTVSGALTNSPHTHVVAFTGGRTGALAVSRACAERFKPVLVEASGNDPFIVMPSAPLDVAARAAAFASFLNCGQVCTSAERLYVHEQIYDEFISAIVAFTRQLRVGNGLTAVDLGPLATQRGRERVERAVQMALDEGARVVAGGRRPRQFAKGWFYEPTVLADLRPDSRAIGEELFGPVAPVIKVGSLDEALMLANDSSFGLGANIYTRDMGEAHRAIHELQSGMVWVNAPLLDNDAGPFGGRKMSGMGRELGSEGLEMFRQSKLVMIDPAARTQDFWWFPYSDAEAFPNRT